MTSLEKKVDASETKAFEHIMKEKETLTKKDDELEGMKNRIQNQLRPASRNMVR